jgi:hypothetical protein
MQLKPYSPLDFASPMRLPDLIDLPNVFSKLRVHAVPTNFSPIERLALTLARYEGLPRALHEAEFTSAEKKSFFRKLKKAGAPSWWESEKIWIKQYPPLVHEFLMPFTEPLSGATHLADSMIPAKTQMAESMIE